MQKFLPEQYAETRRTTCVGGHLRLSVRADAPQPEHQALVYFFCLARSFRRFRRRSRALRLTRFRNCCPIRSPFVANQPHPSQARPQMEETNSSSQRRLFAGVKIPAPPALCDALATLQTQLARERIRWVPPENWHLTLEFFGAVPESRIPALAAALAAAAAPIEPIHLRLATVGAFGPPRHPRVIWVGVESAGLITLHAALQQELRLAGWTPESRPYTPHLTLARLNTLRHPDRLQKCLARFQHENFGEIFIKHAVLFESTSPPPARATKLFTAAPSPPNMRSTS